MKYLLFALAAVCCQASGNERHAITLAVVQIESHNGAVRDNMARAEEWVRRAAGQGADLILMPEFATVGYELSPNLWDTAEPLEGPTVQWLKNLSAELGIWLGTTMLETDGVDFYNAFVLTNPHGGLAGTVRKEVPASMEGYFFRGDPNPHFIDTELGRIGVGICYENYLSHIANKIAAAEVDLLLMPFSFPVVPGGDAQPLSGSRYAGFYSDVLGIPVAAVNKVGNWHTSLPPLQETIIHGQFPGGSAVADSDGVIKGKLDHAEGFVATEVVLDTHRKKRNLHFDGYYVEGLTEGAGENPTTDMEIRAREVYQNDSRRRAKARQQFAR